MKTVILKIDEDNDIYEMTVNGEVYTLDNVYDSEYGELFDELNMSIEVLQTQRCSGITPTNNKQVNKVYTLHNTDQTKVR